MKPGISVRPLGDDIWSVDPDGASQLVYDKHARLYDRLIGNRLYNRLVWGTSPHSYARFANAALRSGSGTLLDAGCGSLVSTVHKHIESRRRSILCDLSEGMLRAARNRLIASAGGVPGNLVLLQADLNALPFRSESFGSVLCPGMLHIFEDVGAVTKELARVSAPGANIFMSSLVAERWIGRNYLALLHRAGEVAAPRHRQGLLDRLNAPRSGLRTPMRAVSEGSMLFVTAEAARYP
ncbi:class I SAM-dependent methyltransferase [Pacificimonas sp. WHA3]|uniref:Class I SAM-dependent methyltransferase n=1 Tax=Pacificimonas pallii TaxID=2827236 RepID=A0ABS6SCV9_9SPHN|nr:class I SAM-dependent methyltransferase [Pacificimonas pallii]MBV7256250.1 class I SAM-dependent methyltransferase [Pacificimonas pallii]